MGSRGTTPSPSLLCGISQPMAVRKHEEAEESAEVGRQRQLVASELKELWAMAAPITAMNCLVYLRAMVSVVCLGRLGPLELAGGALSIGFTNITGYSVLFGLASGLEPLCSQAYGSRNWDLISLSLQRAILLLLFAAIPIAFLWVHLGPILVALGQDPAITGSAATYCLHSLPDLLTNALLQPLRVFLRSQGITRPMAACTAAAVLLHIPLNVLLVFVLRLGVPGVALAAVITNLNMAVFLLVYLRASRACELTWRGWSPRTALCGLTPVLRLSLPSCLGVCLEWWWYEIMTVLAGYLPDPTTAVAATSVLIQTTSLMYTVPMSLAACVSTRVGNELGAGRPKRAKTAALVALGCSAAIGVLNVAWTTLLRSQWARVFTADAAVLRCRSWGCASLATARRPLAAACCAVLRDRPLVPASTCCPSTWSAHQWLWGSPSASASASAGSGTASSPRRPSASPSSSPSSSCAPTGRWRPCAPRSLPPPPTWKSSQLVRMRRRSVN